MASSKLHAKKEITVDSRDSAHAGFDGVAALEFTDRLDILSCYDGPVDRSERLEFSYGRAITDQLIRETAEVTSRSGS